MRRALRVPERKTGSPSAQTANTPFSVTVRAVDAQWNTVSATDTVAITSSDGNGVMPPDAALVAGSRFFPVTLQTGGSQTVTATDVTDGTKTAGTSTPITVDNTVPDVADDDYEMRQDETLDVPAAGVLENDDDAEGQAITVASPRPASGPSHGSLTLHADGSFSYTPNAGYNGTDTFSYTATDGDLTSAPPP